MLDRVPLLTHGHPRWIAIRIHWDTGFGDCPGIVDEKFEFHGSGSLRHPSREDLEFSLVQLRADDLRVVPVEAAEGYPVAHAPPRLVPVINASPDSLVVPAVAEVAEKRVHILQADTLLMDGKYHDPSMALAGGKPVEGILVHADQFLLAEIERRFPSQRLHIPFQGRAC